MNRLLLTLIVAVFYASLSPARADNLPQTADSLINALRQGGFVLVFRHAMTDWSQKDTQPVDYADCKTQRNLNQQGREQMTAVKEALRALTIPVGEVISSRFCRCVESAKLSIGDPQTSMDLTSIVGVADQERHRRAEAIRALIRKGPKPGTNLALFSHDILINEATNVRLGEGEAAIFKPESGDAHYVANVSPEEWRRMALLAAPGK